MSKQNTNLNISPYIIQTVITIALIIIGFYAMTTWIKPIAKIAYVDTAKLLIGFSEANKVQRELKEENDKWIKKLKILEDSLQATIDNMSKEYDKAKSSRKKEMQDILSSRNQQINNFKQANFRQMEKLKNEKMQGVMEKANVYLQEYGKKHSYNIIFGAISGGNILYGENGYDITEDIIKGLNERYK